jgi:hypothetical protein
MNIFRYVATCFAYGQTGSGKTHTMVGPGGAAIVCCCFSSVNKFYRFEYVMNSFVWMKIIVRKIMV